MKITLAQLHDIIASSFIKDEDDCDTYATRIEVVHDEDSRDDDLAIANEIAMKINEISAMMQELDVKFHNAYDCR